MSEYTTGELAKLTHISIRTLQYYDKKDLLKPSKVFDNGKRIYTDNDLSRLKLILLLKNLGLSLMAIGDILDSRNSVTIMNLLLDQQQKALKSQIKDSKGQLRMIDELKRNLPQINQVSIKTINDIDEIMNNKKALRKVHIKMLIVGALMDIVEVGTLVWGIMKGQWIPFILGMFLVIIVAVWISKFYFQNTNYICPNCNTEFKPSFKQAFWARHNAKARKLTCPNCGKKDYCVEVYDEKQIMKEA